MTISQNRRQNTDLLGNMPLGAVLPALAVSKLINNTEINTASAQY